MAFLYYKITWIIICSIMKNTLLIAILSLISICSYSQEHISFNGATFGVERSSFLSSIDKTSSDLKYISHTYKDVYNRHFLYGGKINTYSAQYYIHSSLKTNIVFELVAWFHVSNLKEELMLFVKSLETKYGGHINENADDLGEITERYTTHGVYGTYREMLAMKFTIKSHNTNKEIGEVRISAAPTHSPTYEGDTGYIELTYRDYSAAESAVAEYEATIGSIL
jgi:hypothetical protein